MEVMLQTVVVVFMLFLCALCLFAVVVIARDIVHETAKSRREKKNENNQEQKHAEPVQVVVQPVLPGNMVNVPPVTEQKTEVEEKQPEVFVLKEEVESSPVQPANEMVATEVEDDPDEVTFSRVNLTMEEKYEMLSTEHKRYFDEIIKHALAKEGVTESKRSSSYDYKIGAYKVIRMMIKRGEITCEFNFIDRDFKNYANEASVRIKQQGTIVKVLETSAVGVVKDGIDLVVTQIAEDKEYKKNLAREKRRERRKQQKEEAEKEGNN